MGFGENPSSDSRFGERILWCGHRWAARGSFEWAGWVCWWWLCLGRMVSMMRLSGGVFVIWRCLWFRCEFGVGLTFWSSGSNTLRSSSLGRTPWGALLIRGVVELWRLVVLFDVAGFQLESWFVREFGVNPAVSVVLNSWGLADFEGWLVRTGHGLRWIELWSWLVLRYWFRDFETYDDDVWFLWWFAWLRKDFEVVGWGLFVGVGLGGG